MPKTKPWSDIDLENWREYNHILTDSLWLFPDRARGNGHSLDYHGNYIPQLATQLITRYSKAGEVVLDLFLGSGTTAIEAVNLDRRCIGAELKPDLVEYVRGKLPCTNGVSLIAGNSASKQVGQAVRAALAEMGEEAAHLLILHPPYHDIIRFSDRPEDLSTCATVDEFLTKFQAIAWQGYDLLAPDRFAGLVIGDAYHDGELIPLGFLCMAAMVEAGFTLKAVVTKDIQGNERGKGQNANLWRYRALAGGYYIFKHEYVMVFQKKRKSGRLLGLLRTLIDTKKGCNA